MLKCYSPDYTSLSGKRFDVLKFVLAIFVVGIHAMPVTYFLRPIFRSAVPLFFMMSSYFFFLKQSKLLSIREKEKALRDYIKRVFVLYLFWTILLLPLIVYTKQWYIFNIETVLKIIKSFFISGTFSASWFLTSSIISVSFVWVLSKRFNNRSLLWIGILAYFICCLTSNYFSLYENLPYSVSIYKSYSFVLGKPCNSFLSAILFVVLGKILAEEKFLVSNRVLLFVFVLSLFLLFVEARIIASYGLNHSKVDYSDDCFFSLLPLCLSSFMLLGQNAFTIQFNTKWLRNASTIIYCSHYTLISVLTSFVCLFSRGFVLFVVASFLSAILSLIIIIFEKKRRFRWLSYSH